MGGVSETCCLARKRPDGSTVARIDDYLGTPFDDAARHGQLELAGRNGVSLAYCVLRRIKDQRLVIVEDDASISSALRDYFGAGNTVLTFGSAEDVLVSMDELGEVQVFIIDYKLPGMDGGSLFRSLRSRFSGAKYILITGEMNYEVAESNHQLGWDALILKPFDFGILEDNISVLVAAAA